MANTSLRAFENIVRKAHLFTSEHSSETCNAHPFEQRGIFSPIPGNIRSLFDNSHYAQATFEAFKFLDKEIARIANLSDTGKSLMMRAFSETSPHIQLTGLGNPTELSEQEGYKFIFAGSMMAIRNPRGHEYTIRDTIDDCLDHLSFASILLRRLEASGFKIKVK